jgi:hypothetical protein
MEEADMRTVIVALVTGLTLAACSAAGPVAPAATGEEIQVFRSPG